MDEELSIEGEYQIIFTGLPVHGTDIKHVRENFEKRFKLPPLQLKSIFSGSPVVLQKDLDWESANKYNITMRELGALCEITRRQEVTEDVVGLAPCPGCKSLQIGDVCSDCGFDLKAYRLQMAAKGYVEIPGSGYTKNRREDPRRAAEDRREGVRYEEKRRSGIDRREKNSDWYSD